ncbi:MAG: FHA domain-containing protein [Myxococcota bacterium]
MGKLDVELFPDDLVRRWTDLSRVDFLSEEGDTAVLLVQLEGFDRDLVQTLEAASTARGEGLKVARDSIGFRTVAATGQATDAIAAHVARRHALGQRLARSAHFLVPLKKRRDADRPFTDRLFVGRAYSTDVVLRHPSVSKSHAWFETDAEGRFVICDAGSKNGTLRNGSRLVPREPVVLEQGDEVIFGKVTTIFSQADLLWDLLTG